MKKLNKHPRLFKKAALSLKKLIVNRLNSFRSKKMKRVSLIMNNTKEKTQEKATYRCRESKYSYGMPSSSNGQIKFLDLDYCRKIPFERFYIRLHPFNSETYLRMIENNYGSRLEIE